MPSTTACAVTVAISQEQLCSLYLLLGDDLAICHRNFLWSLCVTWVKNIGKINAPSPSCLPTPPQIWKIGNPVVLPVLRVVNHKAIPSGKTSLRMEKLILLLCLPSLKLPAYIMMVI